MILFYILCLLYVLSTATIISDLLAVMFDLYYSVSNNSICSKKNIVFLFIMQGALSPQLGIEMALSYYRIQPVQATLSGLCDVIAQFILVCINIVYIIRFIHLDFFFQRYTDVGLCGVKISQ